MSITACWLVALEQSVRREVTLLQGIWVRQSRRGRLSLFTKIVTVVGQAKDGANATQPITTSWKLLAS